MVLRRQENCSFFLTDKTTFDSKHKQGVPIICQQKPVVSGAATWFSLSPLKFLEKEDYLPRHSFFFSCIYRSEYNFLYHLFRSLEPGSTARMKMNHLFSSWNNWFCSASRIPHFSFIFENSSFNFPPTTPPIT